MNVFCDLVVAALSLYSFLCKLPAVLVAGLNIAASPVRTRAI